MPKTQQEIIGAGYQALVTSLGAVDAIRFIQYFTTGQGDYTKDREQWLGQMSLEEMLIDLKNSPITNPDQYDEIIE